MSCCVTAQVSSSHKKSDITNAWKTCILVAMLILNSRIAFFSTTDTFNRPSLASLRSPSALYLTDPLHFLDKEKTNLFKGLALQSDGLLIAKLAFSCPRSILVFGLMHMPNTSSMCCNSLLVSATSAKLSAYSTSCRHVVKAVWSGMSVHQEESACNCVVNVQTTPQPGHCFPHNLVHETFKQKGQNTALPDS